MHDACHITNDSVCTFKVTCITTFTETYTADAAVISETSLCTATKNRTDKKQEHNPKTNWPKLHTRKPEPTCKHCSHATVQNCGMQYSTEQLLIFPLPSRLSSQSRCLLEGRTLVHNYNNSAPLQQNVNTVLIFFVWNYTAKQTCILKYCGTLLITTLFTLTVNTLNK